jgi:hypothetical protein
LVEDHFSSFVSLIDIRYLICIYEVIENIEPVEDASFERMISFFAFEAESEFTVLTSSQVLVPFKSCKGATAIKRAPP